MTNKKEIAIKIGQRIKDLRKQANLSQAELAFRCNFEASNLNRIEAGRTYPSIKTLSKISNGLDVPSHSLTYYIK
jgi:transcriptional regulator with XRE-family HTH domain